ncbi:MAG: hypothetical protein HGA45_08135 [Chloroflexales bacterium]|nr:hypothetical protein [Chloroflexales bacterium]
MSAEQQANGDHGAAEPAWSEQYCMSQWCRGARWFIRPDSRGEQLWVIAESPDSAPWSVAAAAAVCPLCGEHLVAHIEGVGEIEGEMPAAILRFIRSLDVIV